MKVEVVLDSRHEPVVITRITLRRILATHSKRLADLIALYVFYYHVSKEQGNYNPQATTGWTAKQLGWTEDRVRRAKKELIELTLIEDVVKRGKFGAVIGHFIHVNHMTKRDTPTDDPDSGFDQRVALRESLQGIGQANAEDRETNTFPPVDSGSSPSKPAFGLGTPPVPRTPPLTDQSACGKCGTCVMWNNLAHRNGNGFCTEDRSPHSGKEMQPTASCQFYAGKNTLGCPVEPDRDGKRSDVQLRGSIVAGQPSQPVPKETWLTSYNSIWEAKAGGKMPMGVAARVFKALENSHGRDRVLLAWTAYVKATDAMFLSIPSFASKIGVWLPKQYNSARVVPDGYQFPSR